MTVTTARRPTPPLLGFALPALTALALLLLPAPDARADDKKWESTENNIVVQIPRDIGEWDWLVNRPEWKKSCIVKGARRELLKLKNGEDPNGEGGILFIRVLEVKEDATLKDAADSDDVRDFFLKRFGKSAPDVEVEETTVASGSNPEDGHPAIVLRAEGTAPNLKGNAATCKGVTLITLHDKKLVALTMYVWPTEHDVEGIGFDLDYLEGNCLSWINTAPPKKQAEGPKPPVNGGGDENEPEDENREDVTLEHAEQRWRVTIDKALKHEELTEQDSADHLVLKINMNDQHGGAMLYLYAPPTTQYVDGVKTAPPNLVKWMTSDWWINFNTNHPDGDLFSWEFPRKPDSKTKTFLTVPHMEDPENRVDVITGKEKRPVEISQSDATKKLKFVEKPRENKIGKRGKGNEALRGCLEGNRPRVGKETILRYAWRTRAHSYRLFVIFTRDGYKKYGGPIRRTLESFEFGVKFK